MSAGADAAPMDLDGSSNPGCCAAACLVRRRGRVQRGPHL